MKLQGWVLMGYLYIGSPNSRVVGVASEDDGVMLDC